MTPSSEMMIDPSSRSLTIAQQKTIAGALGSAFSHDPFMSYVFPRAETRAQQLTKLFLPVIRCGLLYGGIEVAPGDRGAAVWLSGHYFPLRLSQLVRSGLIWTPLSIGLSAFERLQGHESVCEHELKERATPGFAYLWLVGIAPEATGRGLGRQMIQAALSSMQSHGHSACLLRTDKERNLSFYTHLGFKQIHTDIVSESKIRYWLLSQELNRSEL